MKLPMVCRCGEHEVEADKVLETCVQALNNSGDWLPVTDLADLTVDLLAMAINQEQRDIHIHSDQWFGVVAEDREGQRILVECDSILDGLAAIYLHLNKRSDS